MDFELRRAREKLAKEQKERKERARMKVEKERKAREEASKQREAMEAAQRIRRLDALEAQIKVSLSIYISLAYMPFLLFDFRSMCAKNSQHRFDSDNC